MSHRQLTMAGPQVTARLELGTRRRGDSSSSTTRELLLGVAGGLPASLAGLVEQLLAEGEAAAATSVAVAGSNRLRSRPRRPASIPPVRLDPDRAQLCHCPELERCGGAADGCRWEWCRARCSSCGVRCPDRHDLATWQRDIAGIGLDDLQQTFAPTPRLPPVVAVVDANELLTWGVAGEWPAWALSLADAHSKRTGSPWSTWATPGSGTAEPADQLPDRRRRGRA